MVFAAATNENNKAQKHVVLKNNTPFTSNISKINNPFIDNAKGFYIAIPIYKLLEYSHNYSIASRSLRNCYGDEIIYVDDNASKSKSFKFKLKTMRTTLAQTPQPGDADQPAQPLVLTLNVIVTIPLKCLGNFWGSLDLALIN